MELGGSLRMRLRMECYSTDDNRELILTALLENS